MAYFDGGLVIYSAYEYSWNSPDFYGTDFGVFRFSGQEDDGVYISNSHKSGYDWDGSISIRDNIALLFRRNGHDIVTNSLDLVENNIGQDVIIESDVDNGTIANPVGTYITTNLAAVLYDEIASDEHYYRVTFFSPADGSKYSRKLIHSDGSSGSYAKSTSIHSNGEYLATAVSAGGLAEYGDVSGKGILVKVFNSDQSLVGAFIANNDETTGDQVLPSIYITPTDMVLVSFQSYSTSSAFIGLYSIEGTELDKITLSEAGYGRRVNFGEGPEGSVLASYTDSDTKLIKLDVSAGVISDSGLF